MELIRGIHNLRPFHNGCVLTIGNFDGVQLGHQAILEQLARIGEREGLPAVLMTFEPHAREFFDGARAPARLTRLREKVLALRKTPLDRIFVLRFNRELAEMSPEAFVEDLLVRRLGVRHLVVGDDFRFGHRGAGNLELLRGAGERLGYRVHRTATYRLEGRRVSSSWVREALAANDLRQAEALLGRPYRMGGRVIHGERKGRELGFPTANIALHRLVSPLSGIYAVRVRGAGEGILPAVAYVGRRPTLDGDCILLEVHLFDFGKDLYGRYLEVDFLAHIRGDQRFDTLAALQQQIRVDTQAARELLAV